MRLIEIGTFELKHFHEPNIPRYAILSHTWENEEEEIDHQTFIRASAREVKWKSKFHKIRGCARLAEEAGLRYMWIDTCCIDKSSSAELQESINSMYRWYSRAAICYVYLNDHPPGDLDLKKTRWVTRCWTLPELIGPAIVHFYTADYTFIGSKKQFVRQCAEATGIPVSILLNPDRLSEASAAQKIGWSSKREYSRIEDHAYSLMGLFNINMPILYGEGDRAFIRLQEEIVKTTFDMSIFAWTNPNADELLYCGMLASNPGYFASCAKITSQPSYDTESPYSVTNLGMQLHAELIPEDSEQDLYLLRLANTANTNTTSNGSSASREVALHVKQLTPQSPHFARVDAHRTFFWPNSSNDDNEEFTESRTEPSGLERIYIRQYPVVPKTHHTPRFDRVFVNPIFQYLLSDESDESHECTIVRVWPREHWVPDERTLVMYPPKHQPSTTPSATSLPSPAKMAEAEAETTEATDMNTTEPTDPLPLLEPVSGTPKPTFASTQPLTAAAIWYTSNPNPNPAPSRRSSLSPSSQHHETTDFDDARVILLSFPSTSSPTTTNSPIMTHYPSPLSSRRITILHKDPHYIPFSTPDADMQGMVEKMLYATVEENDEKGNYVYTERDGGNELEISAWVEARGREGGKGGKRGVSGDVGVVGERGTRVELRVWVREAKLWGDAGDGGGNRDG